jgi:hypothetical protein
MKHEPLYEPPPLGTKWFDLLAEVAVWLAEVAVWCALSAYCGVVLFFILLVVS